MAASQEETAMRRALALAAQGPLADPNPRVGCVVLDQAGTVVGEGYHRGAGTVHAEVDALAAAGPAARGGTAVVTLEPCHHCGRTQPCTAALLEASVARVVVGAADPNPLAAGGACYLRAAGVEVECGVLATESARLNRYWAFSVRTGRPFVTWKFAATLDGRSAATDGTSRWITGEAARADVHTRRAEAGAILVGTGTVLADDPQLTVRNGEGQLAGRQPLRVVLGRRPVPSTARVLDASAPTLHLDHRDPAAALAQLHDREIHHVWLEGGPTVAAAFWRAGLVDEVLAYLAPALLGSGPAAVGALGIDTIAGRARLVPTDVCRLGDDVLVVAHPAQPAQPAKAT
ncbi:MAG: bifunctional diaminohydroxyphosphoribosylaminopyrimidine deaminase/5-amino-6-(5-phosphoribosylamino)uracil reductase RibD [Dermatophilaceae bacterium]